MIVLESRFWKWKQRGVTVFARYRGGKSDDFQNDWMWDERQKE